MKIIRIVLLVFIIIGIGLLATQKLWVPRLVDMILSYEVPPAVIPVASQVTNADVSTGVVCHNSPQYFIITRALDGSVGSDTLVKYKATADAQFPCRYVVAQGDFEIKNGSAEYFLAITNHFLIFDSGTAPDPRVMIVYDLSKRAKIYMDKYSKPTLTKDNLVSYWTPTDKKVTITSCPKMNEYISGGLGVGIDVYITLDMNTLIKKESGEYRCTPRQ